MNADGMELRELTCRVERLEKQNRWLRRAGVAVLAAVGAVLLMGQAAPVPQTIRARQFVLEDAHGKTVAELASFHSRAGLRLFDSAGHTVADLGVYHNNASLDLGEGKVFGAMTPENVMFTNLSSYAHFQIVTLGTVHPNESHFKNVPFGPNLLIEEGQELVSAVAGPEGANVGITDAAGYDLDLGSTNLVNPANGEKRHTSAASIVMFGNGEDHKVIWQAPEP